MFNKLTKTAAALAICFAVAGCQDSYELGENSKNPSLTGQTRITTLFNGAVEKGQHVTIKGYHLEEDTRYTFDGSVTINGDLPDKSRLIVNNGKVVVNGNVGEEARIDVDLPIDKHRESYMCMQYNVALKMMMPSTCWKTVIDGLTYSQDTDPAITVNGHVDDNARLTTNGGIHVRSHGEGLKYSTGFDRPFTIRR